MAGSRPRSRWLGVVPVVLGAVLLASSPSPAHPLGNFSISHYARLRVEPEAIELRYLIDMAEIPTFQELQETGFTPEEGHPGRSRYLAQKMDALKDGLRLEVNGQRLALVGESAEVIFASGAGGLPTLKLGVVYRARLDRAAAPHRLDYRDNNFPGRAGWQEIVAVAAPGVTLLQSSVPERDRSRELSDYPTDLLNSPPQDLEAQMVFTRDGMPLSVAAAGSPGPGAPEGNVDGQSRRARERAPSPAVSTPAQPGSGSPGPVARLADPAGPAGQTAEPLGLQGNRQATRRDRFTELVGTPQLGLGIIFFAMVVSASLGAVHALEPGHGKTVVAAYLVGSRGTAAHALVLGLTVTAAHTAAVYLLGGVTLYASRYVVPERLYPWLGAVSGLTIAVLGLVLFLRRSAGADHSHADAHGRHGHGHHGTDGFHTHGPGRGPDHAHEPPPDHGHAPADAPSLRELFALGVTGGIVPCPAALVVLLSSVALRRVGFGLLLIVAFSVGLAAVLIAIGLLMVYARRFMARFDSEGPLITRWLPLASAGVVTLLGMAIAAQSLLNAGVIRVSL